MLQNSAYLTLPLAAANSIILEEGEGDGDLMGSPTLQ
jgi:hypothetical protein